MSLWIFWHGGIGLIQSKACTLNDLTEREINIKQMIRFMATVMMIGYLLVVQSLGQDILSFNRLQIKEQVLEICNRNNGPPFFDKVPPEILERVILFLQDPTKHFEDIKNIEMLQAYTSLYGRYLHETRGSSSLIIAIFIDKHFRAVDDQKVSILTYLLLNCSQGMNGSILASSYIDLFGRHPRVFIRNLKKRVDWQKVVDTFLQEDPDKFVASLEKLGNSRYEKEFKMYILERYELLKKQ